MPSIIKSYTTKKEKKTHVNLMGKWIVLTVSAHEMDFLIIIIVVQVFTATCRTEPQ